MNFPEGWRLVEGQEAAALEAELARELSPSRRLAGKRLAAVARNLGRDDVLVRNVEAPPEMHWVHLTWCAESAAEWPHSVRYQSLEEFVVEWIDD